MATRRGSGRVSRTGRTPSFGRRLRVLTAALAAAGAVAASGFATGAPASAAQIASQAPRDVGTGTTTCTPNGAGATCSGTFNGATGWDWWIDGGTGGADPNTGTIDNLGGQTGLTPTVTVDQTSNLTNQIVHVTWTNFTPTSTQSGNWPQWPNQYSGVQNQAQYGVSILECDSPTPVDFNHCNNQYTNQGVSQNGVQPNAVESFTRGGASTVFGDCTSVPADKICGTGFADIQVQTAVENNLLGCSDTHACSIVVVPNWGGVPTPEATLPPNAATSCDDHTNDFPGVEFGYASNGPTGLDNPCAWNDRIVVPVSFAKTPRQYCPAADFQFNSAGSPALERAMNQWRPAWCTSTQRPLAFDYDSALNEFLSREHFLHDNPASSTAVDVALVNDPASTDLTASSTRKFTYAPIATTGISIAYYIDNQQTQEPITNLRLNARLLAKLLTESYTLQFTKQCKAGQTTQTELCDLGVVGNPTDIFVDPEFLALNPQYTTANFNEVSALIDGDFYPIVLAGDSDMTYELTRWIASDPEARAFLQGQADPYGMHVNSYYKAGQTYPLTQFSVLDPGFTEKNPNPGDYSAAMQNAWNPITGLDNVSSHLAQWTSSTISFIASCAVPGSTPPCPITNLKNPPENFPQRTLFAIMDQGTAAAFRFPAAQLENPAGNFVAPSTVSMSAAVGAMKTNPDKVTQYQDFSNTSPLAYPLTEVQYAMVPTCGISQAKVSSISAFLNNVAGSPAQLYGTDIGELPPFGGYLALNDAQKVQTLTAAQQVSAQSCTSPPPDNTVSGQTPPPASGTGSGSNGTGLGGSSVGNPLGSSLAPSVGPASGSATPSTQPGQQPVGLGSKSGDSGGAARTVLIVGLVLGALLAVGGPVTYALGTTGGLRPRRGRSGPGGGGGAGV